jgi:hypothetical protein
LNCIQVLEAELVGEIEDLKILVNAENDVDRSSDDLKQALEPWPMVASSQAWHCCPPSTFRVSGLFFIEALLVGSFPGPTRDSGPTRLILARLRVTEGLLCGEHSWNS